MNGWLIVGVAAIAVVVLGRLWFRWFSRRPLSDTDTYAVAVDTDLDSAQGTSAPYQSAPGERRPVGPSRGTEAGPTDRPRPPVVRPVPGSVGPPAAGEAPTIPRQRGVADPRVAGGPSPVPTGPDGGAVPGYRHPGGPGDRRVPMPPAG